MATGKSIHHNYSTTTGLIIGFNHPSLTEFLINSSTQKTQSSIFGGKFPSTKQIEEAYLSPHNKFLKQAISLGAAIDNDLSKLFNQRPFFSEQQLTIEEAIEQFQRKVKIEKLQPVASNNNLIKLNEEAKKIKAISLKRTELDGQLRKLLGQLENLATKHHEEWKAYRFDYAERLIVALEQNNIPLSDLEKEEIRRCDNIPELMQEYKKVGLKLPIEENRIPEKDSNYVLLQAYYEIHNSLGRRMETSGTDVIMRFVTAITPLLDAADKTGSQMEQRQKVERQQIRNQMKIIGQEIPQLQKQADRTQTVVNRIVDDLKLTISKQAIQAKVGENEYSDELEEHGIHYKTPGMSTH